MFDKASYILAIVLCKVLVIVADDTTVETIVIATTTELVTVVTDIPQSDVDLAMNLDYGTYTTEVFPYINSQYDGVKDTEKCYEDYTKCLITQGPAHPVCAMNNPFILLNREEGFVTFNSHCDIYFDNCQKQMRFWRIIDSGKCDFRWTNEFTQFDIHKTRKFFEENLPFFLKKIAKTVRKLYSNH